MLKVETVWQAAQRAFSILDVIRPNPKGILSETIKLEHGYREPSEYYSATTSGGREYCFVQWATVERRIA